MDMNTYWLGANGKMEWVCCHGFDAHSRVRALVDLSNAGFSRGSRVTEI